MKLSRTLRHGILISLLGLTSQASFAYHYGTAGCGLGAVILKDTPGPAQILGALLNNISSNQTSGISSGSLNCHDQHTDVASLYIESNKDALVKAMARGAGETLTGLAKIYGCDASVLGSTLKSEFSQVVPSAHTGAGHIEMKINAMIESHPQLKNSCAPLS